MSQQKQSNLVTKLTILVVTIICLIESFDAYKQIPKELTKECDNIIDKLELFALDKTNKSKLEPITIEQLKAALAESLSWSYQNADDIKQQKPLIHLLTHLLTTMDSYLNETKKRDDIMIQQVDKDFINRLQLLYKLLRGNYLQKNAGLTGIAPETDKIDDLIESLMDNGDSYDQPAGAPLDKELFDSALKEYESFISKVNEIPIEAKNSQIIQGLLNVINNDETQMLARWIFPQTKGKTNLTEDQIGELKYIFESEMNLSGFKIVNGMKINTMTNLPPPT